MKQNNQDHLEWDVLSSQAYLDVQSSFFVDEFDEMEMHKKLNNNE